MGGWSADQLPGGVPFGRKKYYTAIVRNVHHCAPTEYEVEVSALLDAARYCFRGSSSSGNGSITISRKETSTKLPYPLAWSWKSGNNRRVQPLISNPMSACRKEQKILDMLCRPGSNAWRNWRRRPASRTYFLSSSHCSTKRPSS